MEFDEDIMRLLVKIEAKRREKLQQHTADQPQPPATVTASGGAQESTSRPGQHDVSNGGLDRTHELETTASRIQERQKRLGCLKLAMPPNGVGASGDSEDPASNSRSSRTPCESAAKRDPTACFRAGKNAKLPAEGGCCAVDSNQWAQNCPAPAGQICNSNVATGASRPWKQSSWNGVSNSGLSATRTDDVGQTLAEIGAPSLVRRPDSIPGLTPRVTRKEFPDFSTQQNVVISHHVEVGRGERESSPVSLQPMGNEDQNNSAKVAKISAELEQVSLIGNIFELSVGEQGKRLESNNAQNLYDATKYQHKPSDRLHCNGHDDLHANLQQFIDHTKAEHKCSSNKRQENSLPGGIIHKEATDAHRKHFVEGNKGRLLTGKKTQETGRTNNQSGPGEMCPSFAPRTLGRKEEAMEKWQSVTLGTIGRKEEEVGREEWSPTQDCDACDQDQNVWVDDGTNDPVDKESVEETQYTPDTGSNDTQCQKSVKGKNKGCEDNNNDKNIQNEDSGDASVNGCSITLNKDIVVAPSTVSMDTKNKGVDIKDMCNMDNIQGQCSEDIRDRNSVDIKERCTKGKLGVDTHDRSIMNSQDIGLGKKKIKDNSDTMNLWNPSGSAKPCADAPTVCPTATAVPMAPTVGPTATSAPIAPMVGPTASVAPMAPMAGPTAMVAPMDPMVGPTATEAPMAQSSIPANANSTLDCEAQNSSTSLGTFRCGVDVDAVAVGQAAPAAQIGKRGTSDHDNMSHEAAVRRQHEAGGLDIKASPGSQVIKKSNLCSETYF